MKLWEQAVELLSNSPNDKHSTCTVVLWYTQKSLETVIKSCSQSPRSKNSTIIPHCRTIHIRTKMI